MNRRPTRARRATSAQGANTPSRADVRAAVDSISPDLAWAQVRDGLRPVFVRRRPLPPGIGRPPTIHLPPGIDVALGIDIGPAFMYVGAGLLESWSVELGEAFRIALANLRDLIDGERHVELEYESVDGVPFWWYQSRGGLASGLLLLEDVLVERYGDEPRLFVAPMRNLLLAAPAHADREVVEWVRDEISREDPNGLELPVFRLLDGHLAIDAPSSASDRRRLN